MISPVCGRFTLKTPVQQIAAALAPLKLGRMAGDIPPRYNVAPSQPILAVVADGTLHFDRLPWGLVPSWAKDPKVGNRMINARAETVATKPAFRSALKRRRCLIPADGFYEWKREPDGGTKTPMYISLPGGGPFTFAGLWEIWRDDAGAELRSCTIITTEANELMKPIHDRMPVILPAEAAGRWLAPGELGAADLAGFLKPYPAEAMRAHAVSPLVNNPRNDLPECVAPAGETTSRALFDPGTPNSA